ncbi:MAG: hypothetical protein QW279_03315 [Candidatus Jordarchaeaceae archaeon]
MKNRYKSIIVVLVLLIVPVVLLALNPATVLKLYVRLDWGYVRNFGLITFVLSPRADIMTLSQFFETYPLVGPLVIVLLTVGLVLFTIAFIQTWNLASLVAGGKLWEDWRFIAIAVAALLYAGYITLISFIWGVINSDFSIFNSPIFLVPVIAALILTPLLITISFYRFRKKAEEFVKSME